MNVKQSDPRRRTAQKQTRFAVYLRCSTDDQASGDYTTIDTQRELNTRHVAQSGGTLVKEYADPGKTGTNLNRPGWKELLRDAKAGLFDAVCVSYMSRLGRGNAYIIAEHELHQCGVRVVMVKEQFADDMAGYLNKQMTVLMDGMYPQMVRTWTITKLEEMARRGYFCGGCVPFGYRLEAVTDAAGFRGGDKQPPKRLVPDPDTGPLVTRAFELFAATRSVAAVEEFLTATTGKRWTFWKCAYLLGNDTYTGTLRWRDVTTVGAHEALVSPALWDAAQAAEEARTRRPKQKPVDDFAFHLRGQVFCPHCNCRMTPFWSHGRNSVVRYYECLSGKKRKTSCPVQRVNAATLHKTVVEAIEHAARHKTRMRALISEAVKALPEPEDTGRRLADVIRQLRDVEKRAERVQEAIEQGGALKTLVSRLEALEVDRVTLEQTKHSLEVQREAQKVRRPDVEEVCAAWSEIVELYEAATDEERGEILQGVVGRVEMWEKEKGTCELAFLPQISDVPSHGFDLTGGKGTMRSALTNASPCRSLFLSLPNSQF